uniref:Uncharacterized protein n=1 Tax=Glossina pallidipes TaxID=7398 RepID=A0A1A9ZLW0_GLOPL
MPNKNHHHRHRHRHRHHHHHQHHHCYYYHCHYDVQPIIYKLHYDEDNYHHSLRCRYDDGIQNNFIIMLMTIKQQASLMSRNIKYQLNHKPPLTKCIYNTYAYIITNNKVDCVSLLRQRVSRNSSVVRMLRKRNNIIFPGLDR